MRILIFACVFLSLCPACRVPGGEPALPEELEALAADLNSMTLTMGRWKSFLSFDRREVDRFLAKCGPASIEDVTGFTIDIRHPRIPTRTAFAVFCRVRGDNSKTFTVQSTANVLGLLESRTGEPLGPRASGGTWVVYMQ